MELFSKPSASAIITKNVNSKKYILIQERFKENSALENGLLEIPGGKIREFENIYDCLRREVKEETGLDVIKIQGENNSTIIDYNEYKVLNYTPFTCDQNIKGYYPIMTETFICEASGTLLTCTDEAKNQRWISLEELSNLLQSNESRFYPMHIAALKKYSNIFNV
ncbi:NUDIX hydrolase [Clostridium sp. DL-VIII]|uniref:NUDIX hydrolase n=1 Tax=Clostridium sp. DL-VIII TaxID=641107 RepID=UPI00023AFD5A|nr:NUDIX domain-containing protein [Clostridium sp. DL-VIII]EHI98977.1 NUDIX hydrolase [Clostridium sp. DL-VIII]